MSQYDKRFYEAQQDGSLTSARKIVPIVLSLVPARSVCDVGCGVGTWLKAFEENGVADIAGVDGDYVDRQMLKIPVERFRAHDLATPLSIDRRFDLALSLEVAEHIAPSAAANFVGNLVALAPVEPCGCQGERRDRRRNLQRFPVALAPVLEAHEGNGEVHRVGPVETRRNHDEVVHDLRHLLVHVLPHPGVAIRVVHGCPFRGDHHAQEEAAVLKVPVRNPEGAEQLRPRLLEVDQIIRVVQQSHPVGLGVPHPDLDLAGHHKNLELEG